MFYKNDQIADYDNDIWQAILDEQKRQDDHVELIASENYTSARVMEAQGTPGNSTCLYNLLGQTRVQNNK